MQQQKNVGKNKNFARLISLYLQDHRIENKNKTHLGNIAQKKEKSKNGRKIIHCD